jgi:hypothetical protein
MANITIDEVCCGDNPVVQYSETFIVGDLEKYVSERFESKSAVKILNYVHNYIKTKERLSERKTYAIKVDSSMSDKGLREIEVAIEGLGYRVTSTSQYSGGGDSVISFEAKLTPLDTNVEHLIDLDGCKGGTYER